MCELASSTAESCTGSKESALATGLLLVWVASPVSCWSSLHLMLNFAGRTKATIQLLLVSNRSRGAVKGMMHGMVAENKAGKIICALLSQIKLGGSTGPNTGFVVSAS